jgi:hypothetical protein
VCRCIEEKDKDSYNAIVPVVCIRTTYSNEVLIQEKNKATREYVAHFPYADNSLESLCILTCKQAMQEAFKDNDVPSEVVANSGAYPMGVCFYEDKFYLLSHVVLDESFIKPELLSEGYKFVPISHINPQDTLQQAFYEKLILVKPKKES